MVVGTEQVTLQFEVPAGTDPVELKALILKWAVTEYEFCDEEDIDFPLLVVLQEQAAPGVGS